MPYTPSVVAGAENTPSFNAVGGDITNQQVVSTYDIYTPAEWMVLMARHGVRPAFSNILDVLGFSKGTATPTTGHYERPWSYSLVPVGAIDTPAGGAGNEMVIELDASGMITPGGAEVSGSQQYATYVQEREEILLPGDHIAVVTSIDRTVNPFLVTIKPKKAAIDLDDYVNADEAYAVVSNNWMEGSGTPKGRTPLFIKYTNQFQRVKETWAITGDEATNKLYFRVNNIEGSIMIVCEQDMVEEWERKKSGALLFGETDDNNVEFNANLNIDTPYSGTEGFISFVHTYGHPLTYAPSSFNITDFDAMAKLFELERVPFREFLFACGMDLHQEVTNELYNNNIASNADYVYETMGGATTLNDGYQFSNAEDYAIRIGFKSFYKDGFRYHFKTIHEFNDANGGGAEVYTYSKRAYITPLGFKKNPESGEARATIGYEYKELNGLKRHNMISHINGHGTTNGGLVSNTNDIKSCHMLSQLAFHGSCANQMIYFLPT